MAVSWRFLPQRIGPRGPDALQRPSQELTRTKNLQTTWRGLLYWLTIAIAAIAAYASSAAAVPRLQVASAALLISAASSSLGILLGFLFGIPRSLQDDNTNNGSTTRHDAPRRLRVNTNLEQISDWLTKILVGVGLTQLNDLGPRLWRLAEVLAPPVGNSTPVALSLIVNFAVWGFFVGYLLTRLFLASAFSLADDAAEQLLKQEVVAFDLTQKKAYTTAAVQYESALEQITPDTSPEQRQRIYEGLIYNSLYNPPPDGYTQAKKYAEEYIASVANPPSARIWAYLAAALGQEYADRKRGGAGDDELKPVRDYALHAVKESLRLEPQMKSLLRMLWDPNDRSKATTDENDLESFYGDEEFKQVLE